VRNDESQVSTSVIYTVGHSTHEAETFIGLLLDRRVTAIADVRSVPFSRWQPQFNEDVLKRSLADHGIRYVPLGKELGARTDDRSCYVGGRVQYRRLAATDLFRQGLERVLVGSDREQVALMCAEGEPLECHRMVLVARELVSVDRQVQHIHPDGRLESHDDALLRLRRQLKVPDHDLFLSQDELVEMAYERQEERIAFTTPSRSQEATDLSA